MPKAKKNTKGVGDGKKNSGNAESKNTATSLKPHETPDPSGRCFLLSAPSEIKQKIWKLAIVHNNDIQPEQVKPGSNKFTHSPKQWIVKEIPTGTPTIIRRTRTVDISAEPSLAIVNLSKVCKKIYQEVALTHMFYSVNHFRFNGAINAIKYLVALTPNRRSTVRSIILQLGMVEFGGYDSVFAQSIRATIASCTTLESLEFDIQRAELFNSLNKVRRGIHTKGFAEAVRGLKSFTVKFSGFVSGVSVQETNTLVEEIKAIGREESTAERRPHDLTSKGFLKAVELANLFIDGNGRLGEDRKPGVVASRTRQGIKNLKKLDADGTIPSELCPKYSPQGELNWLVQDIRSSRAGTDDLDVGGVEFYVRIKKVQLKPQRASRLRFQFESYDDRSEDLGYSWETAMALNSDSYFRREILIFYKGHPEAYGKETILDLWRQYADDEPSSNPYSSVRQIKELKEIIARQAKIEEFEKERQEREAEKEAKKAAKKNKSNK